MKFGKIDAQQYQHILDGVRIDNESITDCGETGHAVTSIGKATSSYRGNRAYAIDSIGSCNFDGTSSSLTVADSSAFDLLGSLSSDYTIDFWIKHSNVSDFTHASANQFHYISQFQDSTNHWNIYRNPLTGKLEFSAELSALSIMSVTASNDIAIINDIDWHHICLVKKGTDIGLYVDGLQAAYGTQTGIASFAGSLLIGKKGDNTNYYKGNLDEIRITNTNSFSATPVIGLTDSIIVPTGKYTSNANTMLLLSFDTNIITDSSSYSHIVTNDNCSLEGQISKVNKYSIAITDFGYLQIADSNDWSFGSSNFTIDFWAMFNSLNTQALIGQIADNNNYWKLQFSSSTGLTFTTISGGVTTISFNQGTASGWSKNVWHHVALVRNGNTFTLYRDGVSIASLVDSDAVPNFSANLYIGSYVVTGAAISEQFNGFLDEVRVSTSALWTGAFTPSTLPQVSSASTKLLVRAGLGLGDIVSFKNSNPVTDSSSVEYYKDYSFNNTEVIAMPLLDRPTVTIGKLGNCLSLNGTTQYLTIRDSVNFDFTRNLTDNWTVDCYVKFNSLASQQVILSQYKDSSNYQMLYMSSNVFYFVTRISASNIISVTSSSVPLETGKWYHICLVKKGNGTTNTFAMYLDGSQIAYTTDNSTSVIDGPIYVGQSGASTDFLNGYIDELKVSQNDCFSTNPDINLTDSIEISAIQVVEDKFTKLLMHFDSLSFCKCSNISVQNVTDSSATDVSVNNVVITAIGSPTITELTKVVGNASMLFNGTSQYLSIPDSVDWKTLVLPKEGFTFSFWFKHVSLSGTQTYMSQQESSIRYFILRHVSGSGLQFFRRYDGSNDSLTIFGPQITDTNWHHLAFIQVDDTCGLYLDGNQVLNGYSFGYDLDFAGALQIAHGQANNYQSDNYYSGYMDNIVITRNNLFGAKPGPALTDKIAVPVKRIVPDKNVKLLINFDKNYSTISDNISIPVGMCLGDRKIAVDGVANVNGVNFNHYYVGRSGSIVSTPSSWIVGQYYNGLKLGLKRNTLVQPVVMFQSSATNYLNSIESYNMVTNSWTDLGANGGGLNREYQSSWTHGGSQAFTAYGSDGSNNVLDCYQYQKNTSVWTARANGNTPEGAAGSINCSSLDSYYGFALKLSGAISTITTNDQRYSHGPNSWTARTVDSSYLQRMPFSSIVSTGYIHHIAGLNNSTLVRMTDNRRFLDSTNTWSSTTSFPIAAQVHHCFLANDKMYSCGEYDGTYQKYVRQYNHVTNGFKSATDMDRTHTLGAGATCLSNDYGFHNGGYTGAAYTVYVSRYTETVNSWKAVQDSIKMKWGGSALPLSY